MRCPYCQAEMEAGYLAGRSPVYWSEEAAGLPLPTRRGDVLLGKIPAVSRPRAYLCRSCRKIVTEY